MSRVQRTRVRLEADAVLEMLDRCSRTGVGGWSAEMTEAMLGMSDEKTEEMLKAIRSNFPEEVGNDPEMVVDGVRRFLRERRRRKGDQQQEMSVQSADEGEETKDPEEMKSATETMQAAPEGGDEKCQARSEGGCRCTGAWQSTKGLMDEGAEDERVRVAPNMGAGGSHPQATSDPEEAEEAMREEEKQQQQQRREEAIKEAEKQWQQKQEEVKREDREVGKKTRRESQNEKGMKELEEQEKKLEEDREAAELWLEEIRRQQRETRSRLKEMRREFELKEAVTTATEGSDDEEVAVTTKDEVRKCGMCRTMTRESRSWCNNGKAHERKRKDKMGCYSVSASEEEDGGREASVEIPPGIMVERERNEKEDAERSDNLVARVQKLEEQMRWMHQKTWEATSFTGAPTEEECVSWRGDGAGGEWQRWNGAWWVKVGQQNLNSRQRRQISRG